MRKLIPPHKRAVELTFEIFTKRKEEAYWCFDEKGHCAATIWAFIALKEMESLGIDENIKIFYQNNIERGLTFVISKMPNKVQLWEDEQIVSEAGAKYNKQKNYYSFSATLLMDLFELGLSPYHPKVLYQVKWLLDNVSEWKIKQYDRGNTCSFTYAMLIATIAKWSMMVGQENVVHLLEKSTELKDKIAEWIYGFPVFKDSNIQFISKKRMFSIYIATTLAIILFFKAKAISDMINVLACNLLQMLLDSQNTIIINVISTFIYAMLSFFVIWTFRYWQKHIGRR